ncbi:tRNA (adenosine(37)-N6)-threonylcarbamoyltransferase complex dimerization subunit type 1 TsaB [Papillibacter cinnamivorans]|uniref:tRNA threonylcarbamoyladenosine biosynthesis protein TsaB n=1 Tax=Papillibacter cinnamivorans DSM 12816 TaxID=1122930 RepID=A0A1W1YJ20_9FIRM|nr:tRNA (adenosine(37)-N6)-threonylcarbamoyltransferase complex dimerization subunit type 1 TsaB [Papillibacter cinnamivorans]SMC36134.1 tRNA threonylcarbamoyladenosine biosynthesis protein TsaB [Papillibacter cinnamivorans DSM 12816]
MLILALESSSVCASAALAEDGRLLSQYFLNSGGTHSRTLMPMLEDMLKNAAVPLERVDVVAVAAGPGSFTGVRIGVAAAKGLAWAAGKPCCPVSSLEAMAMPVSHMDGTVVSVMDARRQQVYNALFCARGGVLTRLCPDRAVGIEELAQELKKEENPKILVGDGAQLCYNQISEFGVSLAPPHLRMPGAWGVAMAAFPKAAAGELVDAKELRPVYLRLSQAERERLEKLKK